jgi:hypothetical protein
MHIVKIGNQWLNLEKLITAFDNKGLLYVLIEGEPQKSFMGNEAKALAQLLDNMSTKVKVEGD